VTTMALSPLYLREDDSITAFERAAARRFREAVLLARRSHKLAAIYLFGYSIEMRVKAAYFHNAGFAPARTITRADRDWAVATWQAFGLLQKPGPHDVAGWAQLAVAIRVTTVRPPYGQFGVDVVNYATRVGAIWSEILRYRSIAPLPREAVDVRKIANWFELNYHRMT
jgi:hypothetical protein